MSALARFFHGKGFAVAGYDRTPSSLTRELEEEGIPVSYSDNADAVPALFRDKNHVLVVRTPAVPHDSVLFRWFEAEGFDIRKRAEVLGFLTRDMRALCIAGTHGKTTTSTMLAHLLAQKGPVNAFLGGVSVNYGSNLLVSDKSDIVVVEADEYDRSFHHLSPFMAVVTATDPDHLDIYGTPEAYRESFAVFTSLIRPGGVLLRKQGIMLQSRLQEGVREYSYGVITGATTASLPDFYASDIRVADGGITFNFHGPDICLHNVVLGVPVWINIENAVAAMAVARLNGVSGEQLQSGMASFRGTLRRFNTLVRSDRMVLVDDYAHHPDELRQSIGSIRKLYPDARITGVFQPHLYTRTRDFHKQFAEALSLLDRVVLLPIYPAREEPIPGVTSQLILDNITLQDKRICEKAALPSTLASMCREGNAVRDVVITLGAGDIDRLLPEIAGKLKEL